MTTYYPPRNGAAPATPTISGTVYGDTTDINNFDVSLGYLSNAWNGNSTAIGVSAEAQSSGVAVGNVAYARGETSTAIGTGATTTNAGSGTAIGYSAFADYESTSVGKHAQSRLNGVAIGVFATAGNDAVSLGSHANAGSDPLNDLARVSLGANSGSGNFAVAIGYTATAAQYSIGIGAGAQSVETSVAIGSGGAGSNLEAKALGGSSVAIGSASQVDSNSVNSITIGASSQIAAGTDCVAVGSGSGSQSGNNNTAIGSMAVVISGSNSVAVGRGSFVFGAYDGGNIAIGKDAMVGDMSTVVQNSVALGYGSSVLADNTIVLGNANITDLQCNVQTISALSDARDKANVQPLNVGLDFINQLNPVTFDWERRDGTMEGKSDFGFIAQELAAAEDSIGMADTLGLTNRNDPEKLLASYGKLVPILVQAVKDLSNEVNELKEKLK